MIDLQQRCHVQFLTFFKVYMIRVSFEEIINIVFFVGEPQSRDSCHNQFHNFFFNFQERAKNEPNNSVFVISRHLIYKPLRT